MWDDPNMLDAYLPDKAEMGWKKNESKLDVKFANGSLLRLRGADNFDSLRGPDTVGVVFDEWALIDPRAWTEIFLPIITQKSGKRKWAMFIYTPKGENHATQMFDKAACVTETKVLPECGVSDKCDDNWFASRLIAPKSGIVLKKDLEEARKETPLSIYEQEYNCARVTEEESTLITSAMLHALLGRNWDFSLIPIMRKIIACDPALGGDECVAYVMENTKVVDTKIMHYKDPGKIVGELLELSFQHNIRNFIIDSIGNDIAYTLGGKSDKDRPLNIQHFKSSEKSTDEKCANARADAWNYVARQVENLEVQYPEEVELRRQIPYACRYKMNAQGIIIAPKLLIKKDLGCSPDRAECWQMGIWGTQFVEPESDNKKTRYRDKYRDKAGRPESAMAF